MVELGWGQTPHQRHEAIGELAARASRSRTAPKKKRRQIRPKRARPGTRDVDVARWTERDFLKLLQQLGLAPSA